MPHTNPETPDPLPPNTQPIIRQGREAVTYHIPTSPASPAHPVLKTIIALPPGSKWTSGLHFHTQHTEYLRLVRGAIFVYLNGDIEVLSARVGCQITRRRNSSSRNVEVNSGLGVRIDKYARHNWGRADEYVFSARSKQGGGSQGFVVPDDGDEEVVVEEWTDPSDLAKPLFFWNLNAVVLSPHFYGTGSLAKRTARWVLGDCWVPFQLFVIFWELDNWPVFFSLGDVVERGNAFPGFLLLQALGKRLGRALEWLVAFLVLGAARLVGWGVGVEAVERERTPWELWEAYKGMGM